MLCDAFRVCSSAGGRRIRTRRNICCLSGSADSGFIVEIPENYQKTSSQAYKEYYISGDASIIITEDTRQEHYDSAYDYSITALNEYEEVTSSLNYLNSEVLSTGSSAKVQTLEFEYTLTDEPDATKMSCLAGYMTDGASMYIITCKSSSATYPSHKNEFLQVMQSAVISK